MRYFSGFSLLGEQALFSEYILDNDLVVCGFSQGSQEAFEYVYTSKERIDRLILLSPAYFQKHNNTFVRTQLLHFSKNNNAYIKQFLLNVSYPSNFDLTPYLSTGTSESLNSLLSYRWDEIKLKEVLQRGTTIEVFLGESDKIINTADAYDFFKKHCIVYNIKNVGHLLKADT